MKKRPRIKAERVIVGTVTGRITHDQSPAEDVEKKRTMPSMKPDNVKEWEDWVIRNAMYFTVSKKVGPGQYDTTKHLSLSYAISVRGDDPQKMVYAITEAGRSVMIAPSQFEHALGLCSEERK